MYEHDFYVNTGLDLLDVNLRRKLNVSVSVTRWRHAYNAAKRTTTSQTILLICVLYKYFHFKSKMIGMPLFNLNFWLK